MLRLVYGMIWACRHNLTRLEHVENQNMLPVHVGVTICRSQQVHKIRFLMLLDV